MGFNFLRVLFENGRWLLVFFRIEISQICQDIVCLFETFSACLYWVADDFLLTMFDGDPWFWRFCFHTDPWRLYLHYT